MKYLNKNKKKNKKLVTIIIFLVIIGSINLFLMLKSLENKPVELYDVKLKEEINKNTSFAIMVEKEDETGYEQYTNSTWPTIGYLFNEELSGCIDSNGEALENVLTYNYLNYSVNIKINGKTDCFMYFDFLYKGEGTEENPYLIESIEDLVDLSNVVNKGITYSGNYFSLTKTLDFNDTTSYVDSTRLDYKDINENGVVEELLTELTTESGFEPIGRSGNIVFSGTFNGNENKIENLYIKYSGTNSFNTGFFGKISKAIILNLGVSGNVQTVNAANVGGLIGYANESSILNCYNEATVTSSVGSYSAGGLMGYADGNSIIENSYNAGNISNGNNTGGLVGNASNITIKNSYNKGTINKTMGQDSGGLIGRDDNSSSQITIINSYNEGNLNVTPNELISNSIGGLIGLVYGSVNISNSENKNDIILPVYSVFQKDITVGGIAGQVSGTVKINTVTNYGNISNGARTGGIIGQVSGGAVAFIDKTHNLGDISSNTTVLYYGTVVGGFIGYNYNGTSHILNSSNSGTISSIFVAAGLVSQCNSTCTASITNSYTTGNINGSSYSSGIIRVANVGTNSLKINNVYNLGSLNGNNNFGIFSIDDVETNTYEVNNAYTINASSASNITGIGTTMTETEIKSETFINTLNSNISSINLESINSNLKDYTLSTWKLVTSGYPVLSYQE